MSDGLDNATDTMTDEFLAQVAAKARVYTFAVGSNATCGEASGNTLKRIAEATHATCQQVTTSDLGQFPQKLQEVFASQLTELTVRVDDGPQTPVTDVTPALPQQGPVTVSYQATVDGLASGAHRVCVTAAGSDGGGTGSVTECHSVVIDVPPTVNPGGPYSGLQDTDVPITGT